MQSSAGVIGRALILFACIGGIPMLAVSGVSWEEMLKKLQNVHLPALMNPAVASTAPSLTEAPRFDETPAITCSLGPVATAKAESQAIAPVSFQTVEPEAASKVADPVAEASVDIAPSADQADPFHVIPKRLQKLGATYYTLESWGNDQQMYRFCCRMAVGVSADYTRDFEAINTDPLQAMGQVLQQVESWRKGGDALNN